ncbi:LysR family transcriptional regulator [Clostridium sp. MCC353]|uniref:LysR family transcriptional regulator n=1 Tax=Clostridium sp. MCC353 TaxID=2592646 RepID=UPI001C0387DF|nr:LysR family transcriptional regulator [Clostridium sp. MCC353]MBT9776715.1 LysR family transcriptional regulator [Clostridium sp. MCC353]
MDFRELQYIIAIAEQENISKAADQLYIAQPTLSRFLQTHEKMAGAKIFQRVNGKLKPTYFGERYLDYARQIMHLKNQMDFELNDIAHQKKGRLNLACPRNRRDGIIPLSILEFKKQYPEIDLNVMESDTTGRIKLLMAGDADIAIVYPPNYNPELLYEPIIQEELVLCIPPRHPLAGSGMVKTGCKYPWIDIRLLKNDSFILQPPTSISGRLAAAIFEEAQISPKTALCTSSLHGTLEAVSKGYCCAFIPEFFLKSTVLTPFPACFSLGGPNSHMELTAVCNKNFYRPKYIQKYIQILKYTAASQLEYSD